MSRKITLLAAIVLAFGVGRQLPGFDDDQQQTPQPIQVELSAQSLVEEALYHQIYGRNELRDKLLSRAVEIKPDLNLAQWYQGNVQVEGKWLGEDDVLSKARDSKALEQYESFRLTVPDTEAGNLLMANWSRDRSLIEQERAHLNRALWHEPNNIEARRRAGFVRINNRWVRETDLADQLSEIESTAARFRDWQKRIKKIRSMANSGSNLIKRKSLEKIDELDDADANVALELMLGGHSAPIAAAVVRKIAESLEPEATHALARFAVFNPWKDVRDSASKALRDRDQYDFVPTLLASMTTPVISRFQMVPGDRGNLVYRHLFFEEGQENNRVVEIDVVYERNRRPGTVGIDSLRRSVADIRLSSQQNLMAQQMQNLETVQRNARIINALRIATNESFGNDPRAWWNWWNDKNEIYMVGSKPMTQERYDRSITVLDSNLATPGTSSVPGINVANPSGFATTRRGYECLLAGTRVWTVSGAKSVEDITVGDMVLSQDLETGELNYKPVIRPTVRPPTATLQLIFSRSESLTASGGHPFFVSGEGWVKARDLKPGMLLHTTDGSLAINEIQPGPTAELYNLVVADNNNYFIGDSKILSHDNTLRKASNVLLPGLKK